MNTLSNRKILIGITGSIAAYKACELVRILKQAGAKVRVVITQCGLEFITPMTLQALSGERVWTDLLDPESEAAMGHIELARCADLILIAPASANFIARFITGMADDLLTTLCLASTVPIYMAPAMNQQMWLNTITQQNITKLRALGVGLWGPAIGGQACGETGPGRMIEPVELLEKLQLSFNNGALAGKRVVITAGPTQEALDPVRYLANHSSGKMGYAIAEAARAAGADVILISGPVHLARPEGIEVITVTTAEQMYKAVMHKLSACDVFIGAAAVADYRLQDIAQQKIKKTEETLTLRLVKNPDILAAVAAKQDKPLMIGFAAETEDVLNYARQKLIEKNVDMIVANQVGHGVGFESDDNTVTFLLRNGKEQSLTKQNKQQVASKLVEVIASLLTQPTEK